MAPVEIESAPSYLPTLTLGSHVILSTCLIGLVVRTIVRSYLALPPSSATRNRQPSRQNHVEIFIGLAVLSLVTSGWFAVRGASLSYRTWAAERGVELPQSIFGDNGAFRGGAHPGRFEIVRWLNDTPFYRDTLEIVAEKARYFWWGQQASLAMTSFSTYLAIEGRRRNISNLWAFALLGQLINVSFAQNLWFVAVLLTPVPLPDNVDILTDTRVWGGVHKLWFEKFVPQRPTNWLPKPGFYIALLVATYSTVFLTSFASDTSSFMKIALSSKALPFAPLLLPYIIPERWGNINGHPHEAHESYMKIFRVISTISSMLHVRTSGLALLYNTPEEHYYRHSLLRPIEKVHRTNTNRAFTALERVLGAVGDHPAVGAVGYDVVLSGVSLGVWAAIRALDGNEMLRCVIPWMEKREKITSGIANEIKEEADTVVNSTYVPAVRRRGRPRKAEANSAAAESSPRPRGHRELESATYTPPGDSALNEGDKDEEEDWEMAALTWGLISSTGLGVGSAGVYGAEMKAR